MYVPRNVLDNVNNGASVPVFVQFAGGGYVVGAKNINPTGFLIRDMEQGGHGVIVGVISPSMTHQFVSRR